VPVINRTQMLAELKEYLPEANALTDTLLKNIIDNLIDYQKPHKQSAPIDDTQYYSENLCKSLKAAALLNKSKFSVDDANIRSEKVDGVEIEKFEDASRYAWDDYISTLPDVCPYLPGGGFKPPKTLGIKVNPSDKIKVSTCDNKNTMYL